jgi:hypothetical protein
MYVGLDDPMVDTISIALASKDPGLVFTYDDIVVSLLGSCCKIRLDSCILCKFIK